MESLVDQETINNTRVVHQNYLKQFGELTTFAQSVYDANPHNPPLRIMDLHNSEVQQLLRSLHQYQVKYMLVGGIATVFHGYVRTTQDLDLWVKEKPENKQRLIAALKSIDVPGASNYESVEMVPSWSTITIGQQGFVADFMGYTKAFAKEDFDDCYQRAERATFADVPIILIHLDDLIAEKKQLGRWKDKDDVEQLERIAADRDKPTQK